DKRQVADELEIPMIERGVLNWRWVHGLLRTIDRRIPGASGATVALVTKDVYQYLKSPGIRDAIETGVREAIDSGVETVVVGHSLGSVVAYNLIRREGQALGWKIPLLITLGSPLAIGAIKRQLRPIKHPECVTR